MPELPLTALVAAGALLSIERVTYIWIWRHPRAFALHAAGAVPMFPQDPVAHVRALFYAFKVLQVSVFLAWCYAFGGGSIVPASFAGVPCAAGAVLIAIGQTLNLGVFYRLGTRGVFYGTRFGHDIAWTDAFPFSWFRHPQYVGTALSIWGFFLIMRYPGADWPLLPSIETVFYIIGAHLEQDR